MSTSTENPPRPSSQDFAVVDRDNVAAVMGFFARCAAGVQTVADLTSEAEAADVTGDATALRLES